MSTCRATFFRGRRQGNPDTRKGIPVSERMRGSCQNTSSVHKRGAGLSAVLRMPVHRTRVPGPKFLQHVSLLDPSKMQKEVVMKNMARAQQDRAPCFSYIRTKTRMYPGRPSSVKCSLTDQKENHSTAITQGDRPSLHELECNVVSNSRERQPSFCQRRQLPSR